MTTDGTSAIPLAILEEEHSLGTEALGALLGQHPKLRLLGIARSVEALSSLIRDSGEAAVLIDGTSGRTHDLIRQIVALPEAPRIVALVDVGHADEIRALFEAGSRAVISKRAEAEELLHAFFAVLRGALFMCPLLIDHFLRGLVSRRTQGRPERLLTEREQQVLNLIGEGQTNRGVALSLGLSAKTVHAHRMRIMGKLGVHNLGMLVRRSLELGLLQDRSRTS